MKMSGGMKWLVDITNKFDDIPGFLKIKVNVDKIFTIFLLVLTLIVILLVVVRLFR